jgi:hypothetical protein
MECINCNTKNSLRERQENEGSCKKCNHEFVFEPTEMDSGVRITDDVFKDLIADISADHTLFFTPIQLYYSLEQRLRSNLNQDNPIFAYLCWGGLPVFASISLASWLKFDVVAIATILIISYTIFAIIVVAQPATISRFNRQTRQNNVKNLQILSVIIFVFGIPLSIIAQTFIGIIGAIILGTIAAGLSASLKQQKPKIFNDFSIDRKDFRIWLTRWININGFPEKILKLRKISTDQVASSPKFIAYKFDRVVVCDSPEIAQLLLKNNFHFQNNCAVVSIDRYPRRDFMTIKEMLDRTPDLKVFAFHDCSPQGLRMIRHLRTEKIWFPDLEIPIISAGILPRHIMNDSEKMVSQSAESIGASQKLDSNLRNVLDPAELAWLDAGYYLELESFSPQELIEILQQAINKSYRLAEIEDGDPIVMNSPNFYTVESLI